MLPVATPSLQKLRRACDVAKDVARSRESAAEHVPDDPARLSQERKSKDKDEDLSPPGSDTAASTGVFSDSASVEEAREQFSPTTLALQAGHELSDQESTSVEQDKSPSETKKLCVLKGAWTEGDSAELVDDTPRARAGTAFERNDCFVVKDKAAAHAATGAETPAEGCRIVQRVGGETRVSSGGAAHANEANDLEKKFPDSKTATDATQFGPEVHGVQKSMQSPGVETVEGSVPRARGGEQRLVDCQDSVKARHASGTETVGSPEVSREEEEDGGTSAERPSAEMEQTKEADARQARRPNAAVEPGVREEKEPRTLPENAAEPAGRALSAQVLNRECSTHAGNGNQRLRPRLVLRRTGEDGSPTGLQEGSGEATPRAASSPGSRLVRTSSIDEDVFVSVVAAEAATAAAIELQSVDLSHPALSTPRSAGGGIDGRDRHCCGSASPESTCPGSGEDGDSLAVGTGAENVQREAPCSLSVAGSSDSRKRQYPGCTNASETVSRPQSTPGAASPANGLQAGKRSHPETSTGEAWREEALQACFPARHCSCAPRPRVCGCSAHAVKCGSPSSTKEWRTGGCPKEAAACGWGSAATFWGREGTSAQGDSLAVHCPGLSGPGCGAPSRGGARPLERSDQIAWGCWRGERDGFHSAAGGGRFSSWMRAAAEASCSGGGRGRLGDSDRAHGVFAGGDAVEKAYAACARRPELAGAVNGPLSGSSRAAFSTCRANPRSPQVPRATQGRPFRLGPRETAAAAVALADACEDTFLFLGWIPEKQGSKQAKAESATPERAWKNAFHPGAVDGERRGGNRDAWESRVGADFQHGDATDRGVAAGSGNGTLLESWPRTVLESLLETLRGQADERARGRASETPTSPGARSDTDRVLGPSRVSTMDSPLGSANEQSVQASLELHKLLGQSRSPQEETGCPLRTGSAHDRTATGSLEAATGSTDGFGVGSWAKSCYDGRGDAVFQDGPGRVETVTALSRSGDGAEPSMWGPGGVGASRPELHGPRPGARQVRTDEGGAQRAALQTRETNVKKGVRGQPSLQSAQTGCAPIRSLAEARVASLNARLSSPFPSRTVVRRQAHLESVPGLAKPASAGKTSGNQVPESFDSRVAKGGKGPGSLVRARSGGSRRSPSVAPNSRNGHRRAKETSRREKHPDEPGRRSSGSAGTYQRGAIHSGHAPSAPDATQRQLDALHAAAAAVLRSRIEGQKKGQLNGGRSARHSLRTSSAERAGTNSPPSAVSSEGCAAEEDSPARPRSGSQLASEAGQAARVEGHRESSTVPGSSAKGKGLYLPLANESRVGDTDERRSGFMHAPSRGAWRQRHSRMERGQGLPEPNAWSKSSAAGAEKPPLCSPIQAAVLAKEFARNARLGDPRGWKKTERSEAGVNLSSLECLIAGMLPHGGYAGGGEERAAEQVLQACTGNPVPRNKRTVSGALPDAAAAAAAAAAAGKSGVADGAFGGSGQESKENGVDEEHMRKRRKLQFLLGIPCGIKDIEEALQWREPDRLAAGSAPVSAPSGDVSEVEPSKSVDARVLDRTLEGPDDPEEMRGQSVEPPAKQQSGEATPSEVNEQRCVSHVSGREPVLCSSTEPPPPLSLSADPRQVPATELYSHRAHACGAGSLQVGKHEGERSAVFGDPGGTPSGATQAGVESVEAGARVAGVEVRDQKGGEEARVGVVGFSNDLSLLPEESEPTLVSGHDMSAADALSGIVEPTGNAEDGAEADGKPGAGPAWGRGSVLSRVGSGATSLSSLRRFSSRSTVCTAGSFSRASSTTTSTYDLSPVASRILSGWSGSITCPEKGGDCGEASLLASDVSSLLGGAAETSPASEGTPDGRAVGAHPPLTIDLSGSKTMCLEGALSDAGGNVEDEEAGEKTCGSEDSRTTAACVELMIEMFQAVGEEAVVAAAASFLERAETDDLGSQWEEAEDREAGSQWMQAPGESRTSQQDVSVRM
ncbi:proteophosphoglycan ppg4, related [Neospora caninum Liverpool]|uniref:Proteophosphoglycan ppg4, related n=1 Tax=Neospora caninum (strain Liverpool) TaxID=572307 RepID=F0V8H7_NEOCL|nr:proteophosphoglycan ppg4, related [Neospora caninum Liverpool]CBZ50018.1 proteophosphoglycan ppg4, related [Neospora caninum Liverpool]CEL64608.1 TPA: Proteophosphoglycan ppg4, related [Neospora caninum Liverpool]|eukprot:XP_003880053.1 proteophosphoglycan ppg4, related [Neospora caninum Liverpool]